METDSLDEIDQIIDELAESRYYFKQIDFIQLMEEKLKRPASFSTLKGEKHCLVVDYQQDNQKYYVSKRNLYRRLVDININLSKKPQAYLTIQQLAYFINQSYPWQTLPAEFVEFGQKFGLFCASTKENEYFFPFAFILSLLAPSKILAFERNLHTLYDEYNIEDISHKTVLDSLEDELAILGIKEKTIINERAGILSTEKKTLEEIGVEFNITRERVRQLETKIVRRYSSYLITPFILYVLYHKGSLLILANELSNELRFLSRCHGIPISGFPYTDILILGMRPKSLKFPSDLWKIAFNINAISDYIRFNFGLTLNNNDIDILAKDFQNILIRNTTTSQRVYLALTHLGKPSHFNNIFDTYCSLFGEDKPTTRNIHAILTRGSYGIVWIGIKGTYALEEWGFKKPSSTLYETVTEIVRQKYLETSKPVPYSIIVAEVGKYRKIVNPNSLIFASYLNRNLIPINGRFIIKDKSSNYIDTEDQKTSEEVNKALEKFESHLFEIK